MTNKQTNTTETVQLFINKLLPRTNISESLSNSTSDL